jgi:hypothetical protein
VARKSSRDHLLRVALHCFSQGLVHRFVEADEVLQVVLVRGADGLLPQTKHAGAQRAVFRRDLDQIEACPEPGDGVLLRRPVERGTLRSAAAATFRFLGLLPCALRGDHVPRGNAENVFGVVPERRDIHPRAGGEGAGKPLPFHEDWLDIGQNEVAQAHVVPVFSTLYGFVPADLK